MNSCSESICQDLQSCTTGLTGETFEELMVQCLHISTIKASLYYMSSPPTSPRARIKGYNIPLRSCIKANPRNISLCISYERHALKQPVCLLPIIERWAFAQLPVVQKHEGIEAVYKMKNYIFRRRRGGWHKQWEMATKLGKMDKN